VQMIVSLEDPETSRRQAIEFADAGVNQIVLALRDRHDHPAKWLADEIINPVLQTLP
jgi:hypothetical protein